MDNADCVAAIQSGDSTRVRSVIESGFMDVNAPLRLLDASPALVLAAKFGHTAVADVLLRAGSRIDSCDRNQWTACHVAAQFGRVDLLSLLLSHNPNLRLRNEFGLTAFEVAVEHSHESIVIMMIEKGHVPLDICGRALCEAAALSTAVIRTLLDCGIVVSELKDGEYGDGSLLHVAAVARHHNPAVMDMLVGQCNIDVDACNSWDITSCQLAAARGCDQQLRWLIGAGASIDAVDSVGNTALQSAIEGANVDSVIVLLAAGAIKTTAAGDALCHFLAALCNEHEEFGEDDEGAFVLPIMHALMAAGASIDAPNQSGVTVRQILAGRHLAIDIAEIETKRLCIAEERLGFVRDRAFQVCIGLAPLRLDALQMCEVLVHACGPVAPFVAFHQWWSIATAVKHFYQE